MVAFLCLIALASIRIYVIHDAHLADIHGSSCDYSETLFNRVLCNINKFDLMLDKAYNNYINYFT